MAVNLSPVAGVAGQFFDNNGVPLSGGKLYSYAAGTTTPQATYTTSVGNIAHANPIVLDSAGRVPSGEIWITNSLSYKFSLFTSVSVLIGTWDNVNGLGDNSGLLAFEAVLAASSGSSLVGYLPAGTGAVATTVQANLRRTAHIEEFGAVGDFNGVTGTDNTLALQKAIATGYVLFAGDGRFMASEIVLAYATKIIGNGQSRTSFESKPGSGVLNFVTLPIGPIQYLHLEGISFIGAGASNAGQSGWYFKAQPRAVAPYDGGIWASEFKNCQVHGFDKHQIVLRGGPTTFLLPHQFIKFDHVDAWRDNDDSANRALLMTGQVQHITFMDCVFDGNTAGLGTNIESSREFLNGSTYGGSTVGGSAVGDNAPSNINFYTCTSQSSLLAVSVDRCSSVNFYGTYFEACYNVIKASSSAYGVYLSSCFYTNCASVASGGVLFENGSGSTMKVEGGKVVGQINKVATITAGASNGLVIEDLTLDEAISSGNSASYTTGMTKQIAVGTSTGVGTITLQDLTSTYQCNTSVTQVQNIISRRLPGQSIYIIALSGSIVFNNLGNIKLGGAATFTLAFDEVAHFIRIDLNGTWNLVK